MFFQNTKVLLSIASFNHEILVVNKVYRTKIRVVQHFNVADITIKVKWQFYGGVNINVVELV